MYFSQAINKKYRKLEKWYSLDKVRYREHRIIYCYFLLLSRYPVMYWLYTPNKLLNLRWNKGLCFWWSVSWVRYLKYKEHFRKPFASLATARLGFKGQNFLCIFQVVYIPQVLPQCGTFGYIYRNWHHKIWKLLEWSI